MGEGHKENMCSPVLKFFNQAKTSNEINVFKGSRSFYRDFVAVEDIVNTTFSVHSVMSKQVFITLDPVKNIIFKSCKYC